ncbi:hypothetical protein ACRPK6_10320 [Exiguobacterium sp. TRN 1102]|uniref:hypothetical protein n=1 Tax=Exiguobacterium sp. TRN 1102 TaxID=3420732 RepID=UPI003D77672D
MLPITLGLVVTSVALHGLTIKPLAKRLELTKVKNPWEKGIDKKKTPPDGSVFDQLELVQDFDCD